MREIRLVEYEKAKEFVGKGYLTIKPLYIYMGLFVDGVIVSICGLETHIGKLFLHGNFTPPQFRRKGYFSFLLSEIIKIFDTKYIMIADCTEFSKGIYERYGFTAIKPTVKHKKYTITRMERNNVICN